MLTALVSVTGSPGVSCLSLALAMTASRDSLIAECDPSGGSLAFGFLRGESATKGGLYAAVTSVRRRGVGHEHSLAEALADNVYALDSIAGATDSGRRLLWAPGFDDPGQAHTMAPSEWTDLAAALVEVASGGIDVIVDAGRLALHSPVWPVLREAQRVLVVARPIRDAARAVLTWLPIIQSDLRGPTVELVLSGDGRLRSNEVERAVGLPVRGTIPFDRGTAAYLSGEGEAPRHLERSPLLTAARTLAVFGGPRERAA